MECLLSMSVIVASHQRGNIEMHTSKQKCNRNKLEIAPCSDIMYLLSQRKQKQPILQTTQVQFGSCVGLTLSSHGPGKPVLSRVDQLPFPCITS